ncbi:MAG: hypothetical protein LBD23_08225 [Oscillospiraceae bacterium]|nr:hypothetical protein [Oscillospiraceae bacterium]
MWPRGIEVRGNACNQSVFKKIMLNDEIVGFFTFNELNDKIDGISIQMIKKVQNLGIGFFYLMIYNPMD